MKVPAVLAGRHALPRIEGGPRPGGSTGYFGRESMLGISIDSPSHGRAVRYLSRAARPKCPCPRRGIHFSIKFGFASLSELTLCRSWYRVIITSNIEEYWASWLPRGPRPYPEPEAEGTYSPAS